MTSGPHHRSNRLGQPANHRAPVASTHRSGSPGVTRVGSIVALWSVCWLLSACGPTTTTSDAGTGGRSSASKASPAPASPAAAAPSAALSGGRAKPGATPDDPAPAIAASDLETAEAHYLRAKDLWNEGQRLRSQSDSNWAEKVKSAFEEMQSNRETLAKYTAWLDKADFDDWAVPAEYGALRTRLGRYDSLFVKIRKAKTVD